LSKGENTIKWIKGQRISWLGHLERMEEDRMPKKIFTEELEGTKRRIRLYKTLIRPVVTYGAEIWKMTKKEEHDLPIFEWKIFRRIYGPKYEDGEWKSRTN